MSGYQCVTLPAGDVLFREFDHADCAYVIEAGLIEISVMRTGSKVVLATLGPGEILGELSILINERRTETATALEDCKLQRIDAEQFTRRIFEMDPVMRMTVETVLNRLKSTLKRLEASSNIPELDFDMPSVFAPAAIESLKLESDIAAALKNKELRVHYQPIVHLETGMLCAFEALVRWQHPERGLLAPDQFIPTASGSALIRQITTFCVQQTCEELVELRTACLSNIGNVAPVMANINVTARDLEGRDLVDDITAATAANGLTPDMLTVELGESALLRDANAAEQVLSDLREIGVGIAIDDFGKGYSNLAQLIRLPITSLKINRNFVASMDRSEESEVIIGMILNLARQLGMTVIAEGIETPKHFSNLVEHGSNFGQGYLFAHPQDLPSAIELVQNWDSNRAAIGGNEVGRQVA